MSISIIGAGQVGMALGAAFARKGERVYFGVPDPEKYRAAVQALSPQHRVGSVLEALNANDLAILAVPFAAIASLASSRTDWQGQILVDASNPLAPGLSGLSLGTDDSGAELPRTVRASLRRSTPPAQKTCATASSRTACHACRSAVTTLQRVPASLRSPR